MFFYLSKIITFLMDPLFVILLLLLVFIVRGTRRTRTRLLFLIIFLGLYSFSTAFVANGLLRTLEHLVQPSPPMNRYAAVIVLSGMTGNQNSVHQRFDFSGAVDRILAGVQMVRTGKSDLLVISGGDGSLTQRNHPEADLLRAFAIDWGVQPGQILIDRSSRNTYQNAVNTRSLLETRKDDRLLLITSAFHIFRSKGCFKKVGLEVDVFPVDYRGEKEVADFRGYLPSSASLATTNRVIHEVVGIIVYGMTGRADYDFGS